MNIADAINYDTGLTISQIEVFLEEFYYQDQVALAGQVQALSMVVPALSGIIGSMMGGGDPNSIRDSLGAMTEFAQTLLEEGYKQGADTPSNNRKKEEEQALKHPMFEKHRERNRDAQYLNELA